MTRYSLLLATILSGLGPMCLPAQTAQTLQAATALKGTTGTRLVDCAPVTQSPCLTAGFTPSDAAGNPAGVALPPARDLAGTIELRSGSSSATPFYATAGAGSDAGQHMNVVLMMVDISGSMNQPVPGGATRFLAVKDAIGKYVSAMQEGTDRIAIVPFESHGVVSTIKGAVFASRKEDAAAQLSALPQPEGKNNTGLYQAVFTGVQAMQEEISSLRRDGHAVQELQPHLIVMTDGKNEVMAGDDAQLLNGPLGLQQASAQVQNSHLDVIGVGFGDRAAIDAVALQKLSTRFFYAADANQLLDALHVSRSVQSHEILFTWVLPEANRLALSGRDEVWVPTLHVEGGATLTGPAMRVIAPAMAQPHYDRRASAAELQSLIATHPPADSGWSTVLVNGLLFLVAMLLMLTLWFWVPRLIWGDRYAGESLPHRRRWSPGKSFGGARGGTVDRPSATTASGVQVRYTENKPPGFEAEGHSSLQRSPEQVTQVTPRGEFSRTRLTFDN